MRCLSENGFCKPIETLVCLGIEAEDHCSLAGKVILNRFENRSLAISARTDQKQFSTILDCPSDELHFFISIDEFIRAELPPELKRIS